MVKGLRNYTVTNKSTHGKWTGDAFNKEQAVMLAALVLDWPSGTDVFAIASLGLLGDHFKVK